MFGGHGLLVPVSVWTSALASFLVVSCGNGLVITGWVSGGGLVLFAQESSSSVQVFVF